MGLPCLPFLHPLSKCKLQIRPPPGGPCQAPEFAWTCSHGDGRLLQGVEESAFSIPQGTPNRKEGRVRVTAPSKP